MKSILISVKKLSTRWARSQSPAEYSYRKRREELSSWFCDLRAFEEAVRCLAESDRAARETYFGMAHRMDASGRRITERPPNRFLCRTDDCKEIIPASGSPARAI